MRTLKVLVAGVIACGVEAPDRTRYQSALERRPRVAYPHRDLSEGLEVKASRGLADVRRAQLHGARAGAGCHQRAQTHRGGGSCMEAVTQIDAWDQLVADPSPRDHIVQLYQENAFL